MRSVKQIILLCLLCISFACISQPPAFIQNELDAYIKNGMAKWQVPGLALVIIKDGQIVKMQGYGVRSLTTREPVNNQTHFFIASNSKLFTGLALANLETQGLISLNHAITQYLPGFKLYDSAITPLVTIADMLTHRIGTKTFQGDFTFWNSTLSRAQILQKMRLLPPSQVFRQDYGYCNSCYMAAGEVIPKAIGITWEAYVQDSLLARLGMHQSFASSNGIENRSSNIATPYTTSFTNELRPVPYDRWDNLGPAASIVSNVSDLAHWLTFQLDSGRYQGKPIIPWQALKRTRQMFIPISSQKSATLPINFRGYGLGLNMADYNGRQVYWHTGGAAGMVSNVCLVPDAQLGIAILTNNDNQSFFEALRYQILDAYLEVPFTDRSQMMYTPFAQGMQQQVQQIKEWQQAISDSIPAAALNAYTGTYQNSLYGPITLKPVGKGLQVSFGLHPGLVGQMRYMQNGEWYLEYENIEYGIFTTRFTFNNGKPSSVVIPFNDFVEMDPYTFTKQ